MTSFSSTQIEKHFYSREVTRPLRQREIDHFLAAGASALDLALPDMVLAARVSFEPSGTFLFTDEMRDPSTAEPALTTLCRGDAGDVIDIVAWRPTTNRTATWCRRAWTIDEQIVCDFAYGQERQLPVFRSPLKWLQAGRQGIVIIDADRARWWVAYAGLSLVAEDVPHGRVLRHQMVIPPPTIFVSSAPIAQVAA